MSGRYYMLYLIGQISGILLLATLMGLALGWWSRGLRLPQSTVDSIPMSLDPFESRHRLEQCHQENAELRRELKESKEKLERLQERLSDIDDDDVVSRLQSANDRLEALLQDIQWRDDTIAALEHELEQLRKS